MHTEPGKAGRAAYQEAECTQWQGVWVCVRVCVAHSLTHSLTLAAGTHAAGRGSMHRSLFVSTPSVALRLSEVTGGRD